MCAHLRRTTPSQWIPTNRCCVCGSTHIHCDWTQLAVALRPQRNLRSRSKSILNQCLCCCRCSFRFISISLRSALRYIRPKTGKVSMNFTFFLDIFFIERQWNIDCNSNTAKKCKLSFCSATNLISSMLNICSIAESLRSFALAMQRVNNKWYWNRKIEILSVIIVVVCNVLCSHHTRPRFMYGITISYCFSKIIFIIYHRLCLRRPFCRSTHLEPIELICIMYGHFYFRSVFFADDTFLMPRETISMRKYICIYINRNWIECEEIENETNTEIDVN